MALVMSALVGCVGDGEGASALVDAGSGDAGTLSVLPSVFTVPAGRSQTFVAAGATQWTVTEASGGVVDANGTYTAPAKPGTYHLVAHAGALSGTATVNVVDYSIALLGGQTGGSGSVDGIGSEARFRQPFAVTYDGSAALYVGDTYNGAIRKVVLSTGEVTTIAGGSGFGFADGIGELAAFSSISALSFDPAAGVLYVADTGNNCIRAVDVVTRIVTTFAGQPKSGSADGIGNAAQFNSPSGLAYLAGRVYVTDTGNRTLRRIDVATQKVVTVAGAVSQSGTTNGLNGAARFGAPAGITVANPQLFFIADVGNNTVRRVDLDLAGTNFAVTTYAGAGTPGNADGPVGLAKFSAPVDVVYAGGTVFVADWNNNLLRATDGVSTTTVAGTGEYASNDGIGIAAGLSRPTGLTTDGKTVWIADQYNSAIRAIDIATKKVTTIAGKASAFGTKSGALSDATFASPIALAVDEKDEIYVLEQFGSAVRTISLEGKTITSIAGKPGVPGSADGVADAAQFNFAAGFALDGNGHVLVADTYSYAIRELSLTGTHAVTTPYGTLTESGRKDGIGSAARFAEPDAVVIASGKIYVADAANNAIRQIDPVTHAVSTAFGAVDGSNGSVDAVSTSARFDHPESLATDGQGHLFVADAGNHTVRFIDVASGKVSTLAGAGGVAGAVDGLGAQARFDHPGGLFWDGEGSLFVTDRRASTIRRIYVPTTAVSTFAGFSYRGGARTGLARTTTINAPTSIVKTKTGAFVFNSVDENSLFILAAP
ncbi:hypothetical protein BH09MYX1_BH09MYX1_03600 [soil metagenome]